jgi:hypothetical protein
MSEIAKLLRLDSLAVKEIKTHTYTPTNLTTGELFVSQLSTGYTRKRLLMYNMSDTASGEVYFGGVGVTPADGAPLLKGEWTEIRVGSDLACYFVADTAGCEIRVVELA